MYGGPRLRLPRVSNSYTEYLDQHEGKAVIRWFPLFGRTTDVFVDKWNGHMDRKVGRVLNIVAPWRVVVGGGGMDRVYSTCYMYEC